MAKDLNDVIAQMAAQGLRVPPGVDLQVAFGRFLRFQPADDRRRKKSAWVRLFEYRSPSSGKVYITGAYGNRGDKWDVEASDTDWSPAERAAMADARKAAAKAAEAERAKDHQAAASKAQRMWERGRDVVQGSMAHPYLETKRVGAFGLRLGFNTRLLVPLRDVQGGLHGLQYISPEGDKIFGTGTAKDGHAHLIGELAPGVKVLAFGEGYATCASVHLATQWPVVTCFDAGNLLPVMQAYRRLYPELDFVVMADDDRHLLKRLGDRLQQLGIQCPPEDLRKSMDREWRVPDGPDVTLLAGWRGDAAGVMRIEGTLTVNGEERALVLENAGQAKAHAAAKKCSARVLTPPFTPEEKGTDWNDFHVAYGLDSTREMIEAAMEAPAEKPRANARAPRGNKGGAGKGQDKGAGGGKGSGRDGDMAWMKRFTLIYGTTTVWDAQVRDIIPIAALKAAFGNGLDWWLGQEDRQLVPRENVVFDPTGVCQQPAYINLFDRLPLDPKPGSCERITAHVYNLCGENEALFRWVISWLACPLQRPGAKMRTALVLHGRTEGTGKTKLGEIMRAIYGRYATSVGQAELQRDFNDWMSAKLLILAEEVVSRADRAHHQGMLQALITNDRVQINTKNMPIREEANHANFIFFSNVQIPMLLNKKDRRYTVVRIEKEHPPEYFAAIDEELFSGGAEAFYQFLLDWDLQGFDEYTRPFENRERLQLITLGMAPDQRFFQYWKDGFAGVPFCCCVAGDLYNAFKAWCRTNGERFVPSMTAFGRTISDELEAMDAPDKKVKRYEAYSDKQVAEGDFNGDGLGFTSRQGIVYFVPAAMEQMAEPLSDGPPKPRPDPEAAVVDVTQPAYYSSRIRLFQEALHELVSSARRSV